MTLRSHTWLQVQINLSEENGWEINISLCI